MKKTNLFVTVTLIIIAILAIDSYQTLSVYKRGEQARISVEAAKEVNKQDTVKIMKKQQCQGWNK